LGEPKTDFRKNWQGGKHCGKEHKQTERIGAYWELGEKEQGTAKVSEEGNPEH